MWFHSTSEGWVVLLSCCGVSGVCPPSDVRAIVFLHLICKCALEMVMVTGQAADGFSVVSYELR